MDIETNGLALEDVVADRVTGFTGVVVGFTQWMTGCARASVQPKVKEDGKIPDIVGFDVTQLEVISYGPHHETQAVPVTTNGGPRPEPSRVADPRR